MTPPLLHLGAVTYTQNNTPYAIRAEVAFDFRDGSSLKSVRLTPCTLPESPDFVPSAIDLHLLGRWQTALAPLRKRVIVEIQNASVKRSNDADINPVRLELNDPPRANVAVYVLSDDMAPTRFVTAGSIEEGLQPCSQALKSSFQARTDSWSSPSRAPAPRHSRVTIADTRRQYQYTPIGTLSDPDGPIPYDPTKKYNIFGVVIECRAPSIAKTDCLRSEIVLADESSAVGVAPGEPLKTMAVFTFEANPRDAIPFRAIGDIVRVHRVHLKEFNAYGDGERRRSAQAKFYSSIVLWEYEGTDFLPFTTREPVKQQSAEHRISAHDRDRVRELRRWAKSYVFQHHKIPRQRLQTPIDILEATNTFPASQWLNHKQPIDVICMVEPDTYIDESDGILTFLATDGFAKGMRTPRIAVQSESMRHCDNRYSEYSFIEFCPSWKFRPVGRPAWVVLRDVTVATKNRERVIVLHAGSRTSSVIWNSEDSPDYRNAKEKLAQINMNPQPSSQKTPATTNQGYGYDHPTTRISGAPGSSNRTARPQNLHTSPPAHNAEQELTQQSNGVHNRASQQRSSPQKRLRPDDNLHTQSSSPKQRRSSLGLVPGAPRSESLPRPQISGETTRSVPLRREVTVITTNQHNNYPFSSIADMLRSHREGNKGAHRLKVTARACSSPTDVRYACKPWCKRCSRYLKVVPSHGQLECVTCDATFSSMREADVSWVYSVKLVLEDSAGGRIDGWIEGKEGTAFFSELAPTNLIRDSDTRRQVSKSLQAVLASKHRLDCSVKPYEYEDEQGFYRMACKIFATRLKHQYIGNDCKD